MGKLKEREAKDDVWGWKRHPNRAKPFTAIMRPAGD